MVTSLQRIVNHFRIQKTGRRDIESIALIPVGNTTGSPVVEDPLEEGVYRWQWTSTRLAKKGDIMKFGYGSSFLSSVSPLPKVCERVLMAHDSTLLELNSNIEWWNEYVE